MELIKLCKDYHCIVIVGTEKNAGKTTVLNFLLENTDEPSAITSIGRDGEDVDRVTGTGKPKIFVKKGELVATAAGLLKECTCSRRICDATGINTPLGEVVVFRAEDSGFVQIAGPGIVSQLVTVRNKLFDYGAGRVFIDGALGRKTFSASNLADGVILVAGASTTPDINEAVGNAAFTAGLYFLPVENDLKLPPGGAEGYKNGVLTGSGNPVDLVRDGAERLMLAGALSDGLLEALSTLKRNIKITVADPGKIVAGKGKVEKFCASGNTLSVASAPRLIALCVNPHSVKGYDYDAKAYEDAIRERVKVPVFNVKG